MAKSETVDESVMSNRIVFISALVVAALAVSSALAMDAEESALLDEAIKAVGPAPSCLQYFDANIKLNQQCPASAARTATPELRKACLALFDRSASFKGPCDIESVAQQKEIRAYMAKRGFPKNTEAATTPASSTNSENANECVTAEVNNTNRVSIRNKCGSNVFVQFKSATACTNWCSQTLLPGMAHPTPMPGAEKIRVKACYGGLIPVDKSDGTFYCASAYDSARQK